MAIFSRPRSGALLLLAIALLTTGCGEEDAPAPRTCDAECQDETAVRAVREIMKLVYNLTLQGEAVGPQDARTRCPQGGAASVRGEAWSIAEQGATEVNLVYELDGCAYLQRDDEPEESYDAVVSGTIVQQGIIAVQPTVSTALLIEADELTIAGRVFDPPIDYPEVTCAARLGQNGNQLSGTWCERIIAFDL